MKFPNCVFVGKFIPAQFRIPIYPHTFSLLPASRPETAGENFRISNG
jgi:hypothetical protein